LAEYRLDKLASASGVSVRNIRAYRERGLLDPPRREGRSAYYDDHHLSQLRTINELLRKGFTSAHIAEFFASMRQGHDLANILGLQRAIFGSRRTATAVAVDLDPESDEARRLVAYGLARLVDGELTWMNSDIAELVGHVDDPLEYVTVMLAVSEAASVPLEALAAAVVQALEEGIVARFGPGYVPLPEDMGVLQRIIPDYRDLTNKVVGDQLEVALRRRLVTAMSEYTANILLSGNWDANGPEPG